MYISEMMIRQHILLLGILLKSADAAITPPPPMVLLLRSTTTTLMMEHHHHRLLHHDEEVCTADGDECQNGGICILTNTQNGDNNKNGGTEEQHGSTNYCQCPEGVGGAYCQDETCPLTCRHGSSCRHYDDVSHGSSGGGGGGQSSTAENSDAAGYYCECVGGYKGLECDVPYVTCPTSSSSGTGDGTTPLECLYGGSCVASQFDGDPNGKYACSCPSGRTGASCEDDGGSDVTTTTTTTTTCLTDGDCQNGGLCVRRHDPLSSVKTGVFMTESSCQCPVGWGGEDCSTPCVDLQCQHGASCRFGKDDETHSNNSGSNGPGLAYCECVGNYKGMECEVAFQVCPMASASETGGDNDDKQPLECLYGGSCVGSEFDGDPNAYVCDCPSTRRGVHCEIPVGQATTTDGDSSSSNSASSAGSSSSATNAGSSVLTTVVLVLVLLAMVVALAVMVFVRLRRRRRRPGDVGGDSPGDAGQTKDHGNDTVDPVAAASAGGDDHDDEDGDWANAKNRSDFALDDDDESPVAATQATIV